MSALPPRARPTPGAAFAKTRHPPLCVAAIIAAFVCFGGSPAVAQLTDSLRQAAGEWRAHTSFSRSTDVAACPSYVAWATPGAVVLRYAETGEVRRLDKTNALTQSRVRHVACSPDVDDLLVVAYADGALEVLRDERSVHYVPAIAEARITGRRDINRVRALGGSLFAVAADFGYLLFDAAEGIFLQDIRFPERVTDVALFGGDLYLATWEGLRVLRGFETRATLRDPAAYVSLAGVVPGAEDRCYALLVHGERLLAGFRNRVLAIGADEADVTVVIDRFGLTWADLEGQGGAVVAAAGVFDPVAEPTLLYAATGGAFEEVDPGCVTVLDAAAVGPGGDLALAGVGPSYDGSALTLLEGEARACRTIDLAGPSFPTVFEVVARDGVVAVTAGGYNAREDPLFNFTGAAELRGGRWTQFNDRTRAVLDPDDSNEVPYDFVAAALSADSELYVGTYSEGLYRLGPGDGDHDRDRRFDRTNSSLGENTSDTQRVRVTDAAFDSRGNLWVANYLAARPLSVLTPEGEWLSFDLSACGGLGRFLTMALVETRGGGLVVYLRDSASGLIAYDTGGTPLDPSDDACRGFGLGDGLPDTEVRSLAVDRDGVLWIGTNNGIATLTCGDVTDRENCRARVPVSESVTDTLLGELFSGESIRAIAVDGGNRKWIGTGAGLFLIDDARNNPQLANYTEDNSPLLSNEITTMSYDGSTGLLWIGTDAGLVSFQTDATEGEAFAHADEVEIFPQPVRPDYDGPITIRGLAQDANVKITDTQGRLVFEADATGGTATWDGRDYTGRPAVTGVYFVWATATEALRRPATVVGKIAVVR